MPYVPYIHIKKLLFVSDIKNTHLCWSIDKEKEEKHPEVAPAPKGGLQC